MRNHPIACICTVHPSVRVCVCECVGTGWKAETHHPPGGGIAGWRWWWWSETIPRQLRDSSRAMVLAERALVARFHTSGSDVSSAVGSAAPVCPCAEPRFCRGISCVLARCYVVVVFSACFRVSRCGVVV